MHREALKMLADTAAGFDDTWLRDHPLLLWKSLEECRYEAGEEIWEARKRTASIGDVLRIVGDPSAGAPPGEINDVQRQHAERVIELLDQAADGLDASLEAVSVIVDTWKGQMTADEFDPGTISGPLSGIEALLKEASGEVEALRAKP